MKSSIKSICTHAFVYAIFASAIGFGIATTPTVFAQYYDDYYDGGYGSSGGDYFDFSYADYSTPSYSNYSYADYYDDGYGSSGGDLLDYSYADYSYPSNYSYADYYDDGYGSSGGDVMDEVCCDTPTAYDYASYYDDGYGSSGGDVIDDGCCDAPVEAVVVEDLYQEYDQQFAQVYEDYYDDYYDDYYEDYYSPSYYGGVYSTGGYNYGGGYSYSTPSYNYPTYISTRQPRCTLTATPSTIDDGDNVTLTWTTDDATSVSFNNGIGFVSQDGSRTDSPNASLTYVLVATGPGGSVWCSDTVIVDEDSDVDDDDDVSCDAFTVSDSRVDEGDRVTLEWRTTGATDVDINNGVGDVEDDGEERVTIDDDTTFTLTARNGSDTDTCRVTVLVDEEDDDNDIPRCTLRISDTQIASGQSVVVSWENLRTDRAVLRDNYGNEIADSRDSSNIDEDADSVTVRPTRSTDYTLTVYNGNETRTCTVGTTVDEISVTSIRVQDGIPLMQVPYTGFEAGPMLTAIFYTVLVLWGMVMAYVLVFRKKFDGTHVATAPVVAAHSVAEIVPTMGISNPSFVSEDLPTYDVGYETEEETVVTEGEDGLRQLEARAHAQYALISSDALRFIQSQSGTVDAQVATLDRVVALAKTRFPKENEWMVINKERILSLLA